MELENGKQTGIIADQVLEISMLQGPAKVKLVSPARSREAIKHLVHTHDYSAYGGAPLLGIDGICIICHGSSGDRAIKNALGVAAKYARAGLNAKIVEELAAVPPAAEED